MDFHALLALLPGRIVLLEVQELGIYCINKIDTLATMQKLSYKETQKCSLSGYPIYPVPTMHHQRQFIYVRTLLLGPRLSLSNIRPSCASPPHQA